MVDKMKQIALLGSIFFLLSCAQAEDNYPKDVTAFLNNAESCQHLAGEWDSQLPKAQQENIERQVNIVCPTAKEQQAELRARYSGEQNILDVINGYDF
ncbi:hypothetical protein GJV78_15395 [Escherichia alba]|jgi:PBP1b-binding outer membrane lipoprotein LpoB|uniref:EexN family lipoprotein n=2 Tax=Intestinirhabdus alba TaxID=2899544 RepID=A0A6L6IQ29_9ENTR|nr:hypothetical protein [Intestinirhabdus alba]